MPIDPPPLSHPVRCCPAGCSGGCSGGWLGVVPALSRRCRGVVGALSGRCPGAADHRDPVMTPYLPPGSPGRRSPGYGLSAGLLGRPGLPSAPGTCGVIAVAVVAPDLAWRPLRRVVYTAWMSQPCCSSCMNGTFTSYAAVRMMPAGQVARRAGGAAAHDPRRQAGAFRHRRSLGPLRHEREDGDHRSFRWATRWWRPTGRAGSGQTRSRRSPGARGDVAAAWRLSRTRRRYCAGRTGASSRMACACPWERHADAAA